MTPLVSVQVMIHPEASASLVERALCSVAAQDLDLDEMEVQVVHDGPLGPEAERRWAELIGACLPDHVVSLGATPQPYGYYCAPRNLMLPALRGHYVAHLDYDNEWRPAHLRGLLEAVRDMRHPDGQAHFTYSRREYVKDPGCERDVVTGPSPLVPWSEAGARLGSPQGNFVDTGDFLIARSAMYVLAERSGCVWDSQLFRFGDWDFIRRCYLSGLRGREVDQVTHVYHWHGANLQLTRGVSEVDVLPESVYESLRARGFIKA